MPSSVLIMCIFHYLLKNKCSPFQGSESSLRIASQLEELCLILFDLSLSFSVPADLLFHHIIGHHQTHCSGDHLGNFEFHLLDNELVLVILVTAVPSGLSHKGEVKPALSVLG